MTLRNDVKLLEEKVARLEKRISQISSDSYMRLDPSQGAAEGWDYSTDIRIADILSSLLHHLKLDAFWKERKVEPNVSFKAKDENK